MQGFLHLLQLLSVPSNLGINAKHKIHFFPNWIDQIHFSEFTGTFRVHKEYLKQITSFWRYFINYKAIFFGSKHIITNSPEHNLFLWHGYTFIEYVSGNQCFTLDMSQLPRYLFGHIHLFLLYTFFKLGSACFSHCG